jgi:2-polyprenyl-6-methoxyphenol hydroxylase-like FAD-dependent oxidoreductase
MARNPCSWVCIHSSLVSPESCSAWASASRLRAAFARYQDEMRAYVKQCQTLPPGGVKGFAPKGALMIRMRNLSMAMMTRWPMRALVARQFRKADAITLKDY